MPRTQSRNVGLNCLVPDPSVVDVGAPGVALEDCRLHALTFVYQPDCFSLVLQSKSSGAVFALETGYLELSYIYYAAKRSSGPKLGIHQLLVNLIQALGASFREALVGSYNQATKLYQCTLVVQTAQGEVRTECKTSDAVALSLWAN